MPVQFNTSAKSAGLLLPFVGIATEKVREVFTRTMPTTSLVPMNILSHNFALACHRCLQPVGTTCEGDFFKK